MEERPRQLAAGAGPRSGHGWRAARTRRSRARPRRPNQRRGIPGAIEQRRAPERRELLRRRRRLGVDQRAGDLEVRVHRLAGDEQPHDLARPLEDQVDAEVAHHALHRVGPLPAAAQAVGGLVAAAALDLQGVVHDAPADFRVPHLGHGGLEPDVGGAPVGHQRREVGHRLHGEDLGRHPPDLLGDGVVLADRLAPLHPLGGPPARRSRAHRLAPATAEAGSVSRPVLSVTSASLRPLPSPQSMFSTGTFTLVKRMTPFSIALSPMKCSRCTTSTPGQSVSTMKARDLLRPGPRHDHHQLGDGAVGAPELLAVEHVVGAVGGEHGRGAHRGRIAADVGSR